MPAAADYRSKQDRNLPQLRQSASAKVRPRCSGSRPPLCRAQEDRRPETEPPTFATALGWNSRSTACRAPQSRAISFSPTSGLELALLPPDKATRIFNWIIQPLLSHSRAYRRQGQRFTHGGHAAHCGGSPAVAARSCAERRGASARGRRSRSRAPPRRRGAGPAPSYAAPPRDAGSPPP